MAGKSKIEWTEEILDACIETIMAITEARGATPLNKNPGLYHLELPDGFALWINPHREPITAPHGEKVQPFHFYAEFNWWPFAIFSPIGGEMGAGTAANPGSFLAALQKINGGSTTS